MDTDYKDRIIEEQSRALVEAWATIEYLESIVNDLRCGIQATRDMLEDDALVLNKRFFS